MAIHIRPIFFLILFIAFVTINVTATKKRVHIPDDLHDVKDNEEDEAWIEWGQKKRMTVEEFDPPPENFSDLDFTQMQEEVMKRQVGQSYGFVKLRLTDDPRTPNMVSEIAEKWTNLAKTGAIGVIFMGFDLTTVMFTLQNAQDTLEFKDFVLDQPEAYEIKMGDQLFRRPGDPPFEDLLKELHKSKKKHAISSDDADRKTEL
ncbi:mesoderm development candidate 2 [Artemisia annua]|uniref:Mesoderm development candidate 2 n=1 Tax=Artemisia annua TaxID=35608 RepID=A0A2U1NWJ3_ARTAN|nr:mesoderm development candidate 2 [Artemisia annua]